MFADVALRPSARGALRWGIRHPALTTRVLLRQITLEEAFRELVTRDLPRFSRCYPVLKDNGETRLDLPGPDLQSTLAGLCGSTQETSHRAFNSWDAFLYLLVRETRPGLVVETGVLYGRSSAVLLQAMHDNQHGRLVSVDVPPALHGVLDVGGLKAGVSLLSRSHTVGSSVPESLRDRWDLRLGDSLKVLPDLFASEKDVSIFIHDSLHTYNHQMAEYGLGFAALRPSGFLVSDDIGYNQAWPDFCASHRLAPVTLTKGLDSKHTFGFVRIPVSN